MMKGRLTCQLRHAKARGTTKMNSSHSLYRRRLPGVWRIAAAVSLLIAIASPARAQSSAFTQIYNSGVLTLGPDESLQVTIVNNNNVPDPAVPVLSTSDESCAYVARFLDANGNALQTQQQTLAPGQNFSFSQNGPQTVQARVDISPGTASGFADPIANECVVSDEIVNTSSGDPILFPPLTSSEIKPSSKVCKEGCEDGCKQVCQRTIRRGCYKSCLARICGPKC